MAAERRPLVPCQKCGKQHITRYGTQACGGHRIFESYGVRLPEPVPCQHSPMNGQRVCYSHGGAAPQSRKHGAEQVQKAAAAKLVATLGEPVPGVDPGEIVAERIAARLGHVRWLHARVATLEPEALSWGLTKRKTAVARETSDEEGIERRQFAGTDEGDTHEARPNIWYAMYCEASEKLERLCIEAIKVGLDERRVRIAEQQADVWVRLIDGVLVELGHNPNDPQTAEIVARHLELVA